MYNMKIEQSAVYMLSGHQKKEEYSRTEKLEAWVGPPPGSAPAEQVDRVTLSQTIVSDLSASALKSQEAYGLDDAAESLDPRLSLIKRLIELYTGRKIEIINPSAVNDTSAVSAYSANNSDAANANAPAGWGVRYDFQESYSESEQTGVAIQGIVRTADGQEIAFKLNVQMSRSYVEQTGISFRLGDAARVDPLVVNFSGTAAQLSDWKFDFDLNADGVKENIPFVAPGSGILVFDKNSDRQVNDGRELFGPSTGNGFAELASLDEDKNKWIDENDAAYSMLSIWQRDQAGNESLVPLAQTNIGALNVGYIDSPFDLTDQNNNLQGQILRTSVYLSNAGTAGSLQQLDINL
jgi:hypothetical protein